MAQNLIYWNDLQIGDFFLDADLLHYSIKICDNTFFDLETNHTYRKMKIQNEKPKYYKCDYEVW